MNIKLQSHTQFSACTSHYSQYNICAYEPGRPPISVSNEAILNTSREVHSEVHRLSCTSCTRLFTILPSRKLMLIYVASSTRPSSSWLCPGSSCSSGPSTSTVKFADTTSSYFALSPDSYKHNTFYTFCTISCSNPLFRKCALEFLAILLNFLSHENGFNLGSLCRG